jgi:transposase-like protein
MPPAEGKDIPSSLNPLPKKGDPRRVKMIAAGKVRMIKAMMTEGVFTIRKACQLADIDPSTHYEWIRQDQNYKQAIDACNDHQTQGLEQSVEERARGIGVERPSDVLSIFLLNAKKPELYRPKTKIEHSGGMTMKDLLLKDD